MLTESARLYTSDGGRVRGAATDAPASSPQPR